MTSKRKIVSTIFLDSTKNIEEEIEKSLNLGADLVEIRIDAIKEGDIYEELLPLIPKYPLIFSGKRDVILKSEYLFLKKAQKQGAIVDLPFPKNIETLKGFNPQKLILSYHGRINSFSTLEELVEKMSFYGKFVKIVPPKENILKGAQYLKWISRINKKYNLIAFPTGEENKYLRVLALRYGSKWVYASSPSSKRIVEGQPSLEEIALFTPKEITKRTHITGLLGYPLTFTYSPIIWQYFFTQDKIEARYIPFPSKSIQDAFEAFKYLNVKFFGVTTPYKIEIMGYLNKFSEKASKIGSVNTVFEKDSKFYGLNTDYYGILEATHFLKKGIKVLILGSGGVARCAIYALKKDNDITISSRNIEKGLKLAREFNVKFIEWEKKEENYYDLIVNATTLGSDGSSIPWNIEKGIKASYIFDMVVTRNETTPFEEFAKEHGVKTISGKMMLIHQAKLQYKLFLRLIYGDRDGKDNRFKVGYGN